MFHGKSVQKKPDEFRQKNDQTDNYTHHRKDQNGSSCKVFSFTRQFFLFERHKINIAFQSRIHCLDTPHAAYCQNKDRPFNSSYMQKKSGDDHCSCKKQMDTGIFFIPDQVSDPAAGKDKCPEYSPKVIKSQNLLRDGVSG